MQAFSTNARDARFCRPLSRVARPGRDVWFPPETSLGTAFVRGPRTARGLAGTPRRCWSEGWREVGPAQGRVRVPPGNQLKLQPGPHLYGQALRAMAPGDIQAVSVRGSCESEMLLSCLKELRWLEVLDLWGASIGDEEMASVARLRGLRELDLWGTQVGDAGMALLTGLTRLRSLTVPGCNTGDAVMAGLANLTSVRQLDLSGSSVSDAGLAALSRARSLRRLSLWGTQVTDAGLTYLRQLPLLVELDVGATAVTDAGINQLIGLRLRQVSLRDSLVSPKGLRRLRAALPGALVESAEDHDHCTGWRPPSLVRRPVG